MTETITAPPALDKIAPALAKAQSEFTNPPKNKTANMGKFKNHYADLATIIDHVRGVLGKHGLAVTQIIDRAALRTVLMHESGQTMESIYALPSIAAAQEMGSAITYARRYSLCAILGIAAEEDDDGNKANEAGKVEADAESKDRDELVERMGASNLGPVHILAYVKAHKLGIAGKDLDSLSISAVRSLLEQWAEVVESAKPKTPAASTTTAAASTTTTPPPSVEDKPDVPPIEDYAGLDAKLAEAMAAAKVTKTQLRAYYSKAGHVPETVPPEKLPASYLKALLSPANWKKAVESMTALPF